MEKACGLGKKEGDESIIDTGVMEGAAGEEPDVFAGICIGGDGLIIWGFAAGTVADDRDLGTAGGVAADCGDGLAGEAGGEAENLPGGEEDVQLCTNIRFNFAGNPVVAIRALAEKRVCGQCAAGAAVPGSGEPAAGAQGAAGKAVSYPLLNDLRREAGRVGVPPSGGCAS